MTTPSGTLTAILPCNDLDTSDTDRRIKLEAADSSLRYVATRFTSGNASQKDYLEAKLAREIAGSEYSHELKARGAR